MGRSAALSGPKPFLPSGSSSKASWEGQILGAPLGLVLVSLGRDSSSGDGAVFVNLWEPCPTSLVPAFFSYCFPLFCFLFENQIPRLLVTHMSFLNLGPHCGKK